MLVEHPLTDTFARAFTYLRLSLTEKCNFSCSYCLPDGSECHSMSDDLTLTEIRRLVTAFALLGTRKIRLTGGEPTLRRDLCEIIRCCKTIPGIESVALTTNGFRLEKDVHEWRKAGLDALNVSIDSLRPEMFQLITGSGKLRSILLGLEQAQTLGFNQLKINTVLLREQNASEMSDFLAFVKTRNITLRFIELMRTGDNAAFFSRQHLSGDSIQAQLMADGWTHKIRSVNSGPAKEFIHPDYAGSIGLIMPYSKNFCADCNRLRVSSKAELYLCLFAEKHQSLRHLLQSDDPQPVMQFLHDALIHKTAGHDLYQQNTGSTRHLAMIGG
ncbi:GTP 3',8-cyclase MoaA [Cellvibrio sp. UBA7661]|mgnify:CR=1 FL=1|uniref:GTP 3',8-cyclase MoaA n=1 Tax=Cellvibrio sp. UBA7661 TaxID=1946311 RepID=UPI002F357669